jgi:hypothetical protein
MVLYNMFFFYFVLSLYFSKIITFRKLDLLLSSGKKERQEPKLLGPLVELASLRTGGPTAYLKAEEDPASET